MINWDEPIELDNGTSAELISYDELSKCYLVKISGPYHRYVGSYKSADRTIWNYDPDGTWSGSSKERSFYIVNSNKDPNLSNIGLIS